MQTADLIGLATLFVALVALVVAYYAVWRGNRNSSASTMLAFNEGVRQAWVRFLDAPTEKKKNFEFAELMNTLELGAAMHVEGSLAGASRKLVEEYLCDTLSMLDADSEARKRIQMLRQSPTTWEYLARFLAQAKQSGKYERFRVALEVPLDNSKSTVKASDRPT